MPYQQTGSVKSLSQRDTIGDIDLGQLWLRLMLALWRHQAITRRSVVYSSWQIFAVQFLMKIKNVTWQNCITMFYFLRFHYQISHPLIQCPLGLPRDKKVINQAETSRKPYHTTIVSQDSKCFWNFAPYKWQRYRVIGEPKSSSWKRYICKVSHAE